MRGGGAHRIGDGEKMVRALFTVAECLQPAVIFIGEIVTKASTLGEGAVGGMAAVQCRLRQSIPSCDCGCHVVGVADYGRLCSIPRADEIDSILSARKAEGTASGGVV